MPVTGDLLGKLQGSQHQVQRGGTCFELLMDEKDPLLLEIPLDASHEIWFRLTGLQPINGRIQVIEDDLASINDGLGGIKGGHRQPICFCLTQSRLDLLQNGAEKTDIGRKRVDIFSRGSQDMCKVIERFREGDARADNAGKVGSDADGRKGFRHELVQSEDCSETMTIMPKIKRRRLEGGSDVGRLFRAELEGG
jgi:hypothetical protein